MTDPAETPESARQRQADIYRTLVRVVAGGIGESLNRLMDVSGKLDDMDAEPDSGPMLVGADPAVMAAVGWLSELPEFAVGVAQSAQKMAYPFAKVAGVAVDTTAYVAELTGVAPLVAGITAPARAALAEEIDRLTKVGTAEYARGRVLAVYAFEESTDGIVGLLSNSEELGDLVREQTLGVTGSAVQEVRETGAAADGLTEGIFRKVFRRDNRPLPPLVVDNP